MRQVNKTSIPMNQSIRVMERFGQKVQTSNVNPKNNHKMFSAAMWYFLAISKGSPLPTKRPLVPANSGHSVVLC